MVIISFLVNLQSFTVFKDWNSLWSNHSWGCRLEDASVLSVWRHGQRCLEDEEHWGADDDPDDLRDQDAAGQCWWLHLPGQGPGGGQGEGEHGHLLAAIQKYTIMYCTCNHVGIYLST